MWKKMAGEIKMRFQTFHTFGGVDPIGNGYTQEIALQTGDYHSGVIAVPLFVTLKSLNRQSTVPSFCIA